MALRASQVATEAALAVVAGLRVSQVATETMRTAEKGLMVTQTGVEVLRTNPPGLRVTQTAVEVARSGQRGLLASQLAVEVAWVVPLGLRASQVSVEVLRGETLGLRASQIAVETAVSQILGLRASQIAVETARQDIRGLRASQVAAEVLRTYVSPTYPDSVTLRPWPFRANARDELVERYGYLSEVIRSRSGAEQRRLLRETAGGGLSFTCTLLTTRECQYAAALLGQMLGSQITVPLWQYAQRLTSAVPSGATAIPADTAGVPFYAGGMAMLWQSPWTLEQFYIDEVGVGSLTPTSEIAGQWAAGATYLIPVVPAYLGQNAELRRFSPLVGEHAFEFDVPAWFPEGQDDPAAVTQWQGYDVLESLPDRQGPTAETVNRAHEVLANPTGVRWTDVLEAAAVAERPWNWPCTSRADALAQRRWLDRRKGLVVPFWAPTREWDLTLASDGTAGGAEITIERIEYSGLMWPGSYGRRHLAVYARGQSPSYHYVSSTVDLGGDTERLTITPALPADWPAATTRISFLRFSRLADPFVERRWAGGCFCRAELPFVEIPKEAPVYSEEGGIS